MQSKVTNDQEALDMLYLANCALNEKEADTNCLADFPMSRIFQLAEEQSLGSLTYFGIASYAEQFTGKEGDLTGEDQTTLFSKWRDVMLRSTRRQVLFDVERSAILDFLEQNQIRYMPLKGSVIKDLYPNPVMREMSDNDILYENKDKAMERIHAWFKQRGYHTEHVNESKDDVYKKKPIYNIEMHRALFLSFFNKKLAAYFEPEKLWDRSVPDNSKKYQYRMTDEDFYLYLLGHAFDQKGGVGFRIVMDIEVFLRAKGESLDETIVQKGLEETDMVEFEQKVRRMTQLLVAPSYDNLIAEYQAFSDSEKQFFHQMTKSGTYGDGASAIENVRSIIQENGGGTTKTDYITNRLFPRGEYLKALSPDVYEHKIKYPAWVTKRILSRGIPNMKQYLREVRILRNTNHSSSAQKTKNSE